ncbi:acyltransferase [Segatella asaccharophila]
MIKKINSIITKMKGESFVIDDLVPTSYIFYFFLSKIFCLIYGIVRLRCFKTVFIHPSSTIKCASKLKFGKNFSVGRLCYIDALSKHGLICGDNVSLGFFTHIELTGSLKLLGQGMIVGNNVGLGTHGYYGSGTGLLEIGDNTIFGNYVSVHPENHNYSNLNLPIRSQGVNGKGIKIGSDCWIGAKATILDGTILGDHSIVAAGAVVKGIFPPYSVIGGVPAKILKMRK